MPYFEFNVWCAYWLFIGITIGSTIMFSLNRRVTKKLRDQIEKFVELLTHVAIRNTTLNRVAKRSIAINEEILNKGCITCLKYMK